MLTQNIVLPSFPASVTPEISSSGEIQVSLDPLFPDLLIELITRPNPPYAPHAALLANVMISHAALHSNVMASGL
jgi:hypothetical protein